MIKHFIYTKKDGSTSERYVYEIKPVSDLMLGLDLTEYSDEDRAHYINQLDLLYSDVRDAIADMGLSSQYRNFKGDGIEDIST